MEFYLTQHNAGGARFEHQISEDEWQALNDLLTEIRQKKQHEMVVQKCKLAISLAISDAVSVIGLEDTKAIVKELSRELREFK